MFKSRISIFAVIAFLSSSLTAAVFAHGEDDIEGVEELHQGIVLTATTNAPAGATGKAQFDGVCDHGTNAATLVVETSGLSNGTYTVSVTDLSGTNTYDLGSLIVGASSGDDEGDDEGDGHGGCRFKHGFDFGSWTNWICHSGITNTFDSSLWTNRVASWTNWFCGNSTNLPPRHGWGHEDHKQGGAAFVLPDGVNPIDIASVAISDANTNDVLVGDFTGLTNIVVCHFDADCDVIASTNAPSVTGRASISVTVKNGKSHGKFLLTAQGAPASQKLIIEVNGVARGKARSDKNGNVNIKNIHQKNLMAVKSVVVTDKNHNVIFSVKF
jgi:hypothetical protein